MPRYNPRKDLKDFIKKSVITLCFVLLFPVYLLHLILGMISTDRDALLASFSQFFSLIPGKFGNYLRVVFYSQVLKRCELDSLISFNTLFFQQDTEIESGVYIGPQCNIGKCSIGKNTLLGSGIHILSGKNQHLTENLEIPIKEQGGEFRKIKIGENCWIGNCSVIMAEIGSHSIIGAGSVVVEDIPEYAIAVGNPAKVIKFRNSTTMD